MRLFLLTFFLVYGSVHAYVFLKAKQAFAFGWGTGLSLVLVFALLTSAPVLTHLLVRYDQEHAARGLAFAGYTWMGFVFFLFCLNLTADAARLLLWTAGRSGIAGNLSPLFAGRAAFLCLAGLAAALSAYSAFEASRIEVVRVRIATDRLPPGVPAVRIAQISDLHLGLVHRNGKAREVAAIVARERPDIFVSTGDLVDGELDHINGLSEIFRNLRAPMGKYAVTGNHEYYRGLRQSIDFTRKAGFTVLRNESVVAGGAVRIAGVDDPTQDRLGESGRPPEADVLGDRPDGRFTVLLKHRPAIEPGSAGKFDLQLSGHTHHGQIFPFRLLTRLVYPLLGGDHAVPGGGTLHVNRGTGTWGPPMRFLAPPEIAIIDLEGSR
ncbi:MAG: metallophosphoesterase [Deltaproteobacteria bacterium]|nr:metallophosphoesterase [Deltaproteobacteria bacterium]